MKWIKKGNIKGPTGPHGPAGPAGPGWHGVFNQANLNGVPHTDNAVVTHDFGGFHMGDILGWHGGKENKWVKFTSLVGPKGKDGRQGVDGAKGKNGNSIILVGTKAQLTSASHDDIIIVTHNFDTFKAGDLLHHGGSKHDWYKVISIIGPKGPTGVVHYNDPGTF